MSPAAKSFFTKQKEPQKRRFEEKGKHPFHGQGLADDTSGKAGKPRPVGPKLKLHGDASNHAKEKADAKDFAPKLCSPVEPVVIFPQCQAFQHDNQERQPHRQLGKQVMKGNGKGKLPSVDSQGVVHIQKRTFFPTAGRNDISHPAAKARVVSSNKDNRISTIPDGKRERKRTKPNSVLLVFPSYIADCLKSKSTFRAPFGGGSC